MADKPPKDKIQVEPSINPKLKDFAEWLIESFYGPGDYPEKIEVRIVYGPRLATTGALIKQILYPPNMVEDSKDDKETNGNGKTEKKRAKPNREELIGLANEISARCQNDCDGVGRDTDYAVHLIHFARSDDPYERWVLKKHPAVPKSRGEVGNGEEGDDEYGGHGLARVEGQRLGHHERMFSMVGGMLESLVDRQDRIIVRQEEALRAADERHARSMELVEKARQLEHERQMQRDLHEVKMKAIDKGVELFTGLAPSFMGMITGKKTDGIQESSESFTLKLFFKHEKDGGKMTDEQLDAAFGAFDDSPEQNQIRPGVLSVPQGKLLYDVAQCRVPASELEKLLPDSGELSLTQQQIVQLQQIFGDQLIPLMAMVGTIMHQKQARDAQKPQPTPQPQQPQP